MVSIDDVRNELISAVNIIPLEIIATSLQNTADVRSELTDIFSASASLPARGACVALRQAEALIRSSKEKATVAQGLIDSYQKQM